MKGKTQLELRLDEMLDYLNITKIQFECKTNLPSGYLLTLVGLPEVPKAVREKIAAAFPEINADWFSTGEGNMLK